MLNYKIAFFITILITIPAYAQTVVQRKSIDIELYSFTAAGETREALPLTFLPVDLAISPGGNIYLVERRALKIIRIDGDDQICTSITLDDDPVINAAISVGIISDKLRPYNLKIAVDKDENLFVMLLLGESIKKIIRYNKELKKDDKFELHKPFPGFLIREFLINSNNELLIRTFPPAPIGYEKEVQKGLVFSYNADGIYLGRTDPLKTDFAITSKLRKDILGSNTFEDNLLIVDDSPFVKINPNGEKFIYCIKRNSSGKIDRNTKYSSKDLKLEILKIGNEYKSEAVN